MKTYLYQLILILVCHTSMAQLPNGDFENWSINSFGLDDPDGWATYNYGVETASQYQPAQHGNIAVKLVNDDSQGFMLPGSIECNFPVSVKPTAFEGYYLAAFEPGDKLVITAYMYAAGQTPIGVGTVDISASSSSYLPFSVPISYSTMAQPDSGFIVVYLEAGSQNNLNGYAVIDNVSLVVATAVEENQKVISFDAWPNPVSSMLHFSCDLPGIISAEVYDLQGRLVNRKIFSGEMVNETIDVSALVDGIYLLQISDGKKRGTKKIAVAR